MTDVYVIGHLRPQSQHDIPSTSILFEDALRHSQGSLSNKVIDISSLYSFYIVKLYFYHIFQPFSD